MITYIGTKIVRATPMTRQEYNDFRGWAVPVDENPADEGYLVEYMDGGKPNTGAYAGYVSWSPKTQFDQAYVQVGDVQAGLAPHEVRVIAERAELVDRFDKLKRFIGSDQFEALQREDRFLLSEQLHVMATYNMVLTKRINRFLASAAEFALPAKACDLSGEGTCEACQ